MAEVYDLNMKKIFAKQVSIDIPEDGVLNDIFKVEFPENTTSIQFIKLRLLDEKNKQVGSNFYWRSNNKYEGRKTLTGPATAGFQDINKLTKTKISVKYTTVVEDGKHFIKLNLKNTGKSLSFFTQIQWLDSRGNPVRPSFYSNNFMCLLPGESEQIQIETSMSKLQENEYNLIIKGFNTDKQIFKVKLK